MLLNTSTPLLVQKMRIVEIEQGTDSWLLERAGNVSASCFHMIFTATGSRTTGETRKRYLYQLAGERISGAPEEGFETEWMVRGRELEADARLSFEGRNGVLVQQVGLVYPDDSDTISCSPDGLISGDIGFEAKCPKLSTHIGYLDGGKLPTKYKPQVQGSMVVTGYDQWWFVSYHPAIRPLEVLVDRDEKYCSLLDEAVREFDAEVSTLVERLR